MPDVNWMSRGMACTPASPMLLPVRDGVAVAGASRLLRFLFSCAMHALSAPIPSRGNMLHRKLLQLILQPCENNTQDHHWRWYCCVVLCCAVYILLCNAWEKPKVKSCLFPSRRCLLRNHLLHCREAWHLHCFRSRPKSAKSERLHS